MTTLLERGADFVYGILERTALETGEFAAWHTLSYQNEIILRRDLWDGVPGIAVFLADYASVTGRAQARELAARALRWSAAQTRTAPHPDPEERPSLGRGAGGLAMAYLHLAAAGEAAALDEAVRLAGEVSTAPPGRNPGLLWGTAGETLALVRTWQATRDAALLDAAVARGALLRDQVVPGALAAMVGTGGRPVPLGLAAGMAGVGRSLTALRAATGDESWEAAIRGLIDALRGKATTASGSHAAAHGLGWPARPPTEPGREAPVGYEWCIGTPGIGLFFAAASEVLRDPEVLETALAAGEATYARGDARGNSSLCHGLAGGGELLVQLHRVTGDGRWLNRAGEFAERAYAHRLIGENGDAWPADEPGLVAANLSTGAAGAGRLFLQVAAPSRISALFF